MTNLFLFCFLSLQRNTALKKGRENENIRKKIRRSTGTREPECKSSHGNRKVPKKIVFYCNCIEQYHKIKKEDMKQKNNNNNNKIKEARELAVASVGAN